MASFPLKRYRSLLLRQNPKSPSFRKSVFSSYLSRHSSSSFSQTTSFTSFTDVSIKKFYSLKMTVRLKVLYLSYLHSNDHKPLKKLYCFNFFFIFVSKLQPNYRFEPSKHGLVRNFLHCASETSKN